MRQPDASHADHAMWLPSGANASAGTDLSNAEPAGGAMVKRAAGVRVERSACVSCHTATAAMNAQMIAALQGTSCPPIDGETTSGSLDGALTIRGSTTGDVVETGATNR